MTETVPIDFPGYVVQALAGRGGMGRVYRAEQLATRRLVAIKLLTAGPGGGPPRSAPPPPPPPPPPPRPPPRPPPHRRRGGGGAGVRGGKGPRFRAPPPAGG